MWGMSSHLDCWSGWLKSQWLLACYPSLRHHLCHWCIFFIWRNEDGRTRTVLPGIFKNAESSNCSLWPCEYWSSSSYSIVHLFALWVEKLFDVLVAHYLMLIFLFWNRLGRSQQTAFSKVFLSGRLCDMRWTASARRSPSSVLRAPRICLRFQWMETASITVSRMQLGTPKHVLCHSFCINKNVHQVFLDCNISFVVYLFVFRTEVQAIFEGVFIAMDEDVSRFVDYIHSTTKHVKLQTVCVTTMTSFWIVCLSESGPFSSITFYILGLWKRCLWRGVVSSQGDLPKIHQQGRRGGTGACSVSAWSVAPCSEYVQGRNICLSPVPARKAFK